MQVDELKEHISSYAVELLKERGISKLYPPQEEAVRRGLFSGRNMVIAIPTASGKTLIAELAMIHEVIRGGKCLYTVPLKALASEKYREFRKWSDIGVEVGISTGDYDSRDEWLGNADIIVTTSEKADSLVRNQAGWIRNISMLVIDEAHLIDSAKRGAVIEVLVAKLRKINPSLRILALSATIPNADEIAEWLNAELVESEWRPIPLYEGVFYPGKILKLNEGGVIEVKAGRNVESVVKETLEEGGQVLIFESTRRNAESLAEKLSSVVRDYAEDCSDLAEEVLIENEGEMSQRLARCVRYGSAFHHAGLLNYQRELIERAFRERRVKVICATPTLAAGVNLPARRVIVKGIRRYESGMGSVFIKVSEYKQMAGRAGRPGLDSYGEALIVAKTRNEAVEMMERFVLGEPEKVTSKLGSENHLRFHTLSVIAEGIANTLEGIEDFFSSTFFAYQNEFTMRWEIQRIVLQLEKWGFVRSDGTIVATEIGDLISRLYIDPLTGYIFKEAARRFDNLTEMALLHLICRTPDMELLYLRKSDEWVEEEAYAFRDELTYFPSYYSSEYDWFLREFKTALCLHDWVNERDEDVICSKYGIAPGDLRRVVETAEWLFHALERIMEHHGNGLSVEVGRLGERIRHGVREELVELVKLKWIGRKRARKLYNAGIKSLDDLVEKRSVAERLIGKRIVERVLAEHRR
ncbi:Superfamily II helicase [Geoglobus ahangari]|uniref:ATP-dependent DNA helicase Hel308 n=1 Tax=Geoglobus ahangari TaxID=113653 RepID=A0A0F7IH52_9EURY|nr:ATP-dependent DNA helicase [Geoglobus ahangari]AKG92229.1 Superfamily II helicase [Geoglobus ahangari]